MSAKGVRQRGRCAMPSNRDGNGGRGEFGARLRERSLGYLAQHACYCRCPKNSSSLVRTLLRMPVCIIAGKGNLRRRCTAVDARDGKQLTKLVSLFIGGGRARSSFTSSAF